MNTLLIQRLANTAKNLVTKDKYTVDTWIHEYNEQFARLIVERCISEVAVMGVHYYENTDISWSCATINNNLKEIFGVEYEYSNGNE